MAIERTIKINVPDWAFWQALSLTEFDEERAGYYDCDWQVNGQINWIAKTSAESFYGKILQISKMRYLSYIKYTNRQHQGVTSVISYNLLPFNGYLIVKFSSDFLQAQMIHHRNSEAVWLETHLAKLADISSKIHLLSQSNQYHA